MLSNLSVTIIKNVIEIVGNKNQSCLFWLTASFSPQGRLFFIEEFREED